MITEENKEIEVFGTVEVSVKEFMGLSKKNLVVLENYDKAKENLLELKSKYEARITELIAKERLSKEELKELIAIRGELRSPRYLMQNFKKDNVSVFATYSKNDKSKWDDLIEINEPLEDTADVKIKAEEAIVQAEKDAEAKAEENRIDKIKTDIDNIETYCSEIVQKMTFENMKFSAESIEQSLNSEYDFEEYDLLFDQVKARVTKSLLDRTNDITARENQRLENEAMKQEIFDVRINRLKELNVNLSINNDEVTSSFFNEFQIELFSSEDIFNMDSVKFENTLTELKKSREKQEQDKRDAEIKKQKDEQFEVCKTRFGEIGFGITQNEHFFFCRDFSSISVSVDSVYNASVTEFEQILSKAKQDVIDAEEQKKAEANKLIHESRKELLLPIIEFVSLENRDMDFSTLTEKEWNERYQYSLSEKEKSEKEAKKKADAENKARVKRLAKDKESIQNALTLIKETVIGEIVFRKYDNEETESFRAKLEVDFDKFIDDCSTQLNEL